MPVSMKYASTLVRFFSTKPSFRLPMHVQGIGPSATLGAQKKAEEFRAKGRRIINLTAGEPSGIPTLAVRSAMAAFVQKGHPLYSSAAQIINMAKMAVADHLNSTYTGGRIKKEHITMTNSGKEALSLAMQVMLPGKKVFLADHYWTSYVPMIQVFGGTPVFVKTIDGKMTPETLREALVREGFKEEDEGILLFAPIANPDSVMYRHDELTALGKVLETHSKIAILSDNIYEKTEFEGPFHDLGSANPSLESRTVRFVGTTKGHRLRGSSIVTTMMALDGEKEMPLIEKIANVQAHICGHPNLSMLIGLIEAYKTPTADVRAQADAIKRIVDTVYPHANNVLGWKVGPKPTGGLYLTIDIEEAKGIVGAKSSREYADLILEKAGVAFVAGEDFGMPNHIRLSVCGRVEDILEAFKLVHSATQEILFGMPIDGHRLSC